MLLPLVLCCAAAAAAAAMSDTGGVKKGRLTDDHGTSGQAVLSFVANTSECCSTCVCFARCLTLQLASVTDGVSFAMPHQVALP
jgi:hypothetical protein